MISKFYYIKVVWQFGNTKMVNIIYFSFRTFKILKYYNVKCYIGGMIYGLTKVSPLMLNTSEPTLFDPNGEWLALSF